MTTVSKSISINIIGSGGMGHLWTSYLLDKQIDTCLYAKQPRTSQKLEVKSPQRKFTCNIAHQSLTQWRKADFIILCIKATGVKTLCQQLKEITTNHPPILMMMNGMGIIEIAQYYLPNTIICQASTNHGAQLQKHQLLHTGNGQTLIGDIGDDEQQSISRKKFAPLIEHLNIALPTTSWNTNHLETLWTKLLINSIINPLTAIYDVANGQLIQDPILNQQAKKLTQQLAPIIQKYLPTQTWQSIFEKVETIANQTYTNISSMRQDILIGRKTEIDFISGYLLKMATKQQIKLIDHEKIVNRVKMLENET